MLLQVGEPGGHVRNLVIDERRVRPVPAALGAVVDPDRHHAEVLRGAEVLRHVLDEQGAGRVDGEALAQAPVAGRVGLGAVGAGMDIVDAVEAVGEPEVRDRNVSLGIEKDVLWLEVAVDDPGGVEA